MPQKKRKPRTRPTDRAKKSLGFLVLAYLFALLCAGAGVLVLAFGSGEPGADVLVGARDVSIVGWMLIVLGVLAAGLSVAIQCTNR